MLIILACLQSRLHHGNLKKKYDGQESMSNLGLSSQGNIIELPLTTTWLPLDLQTM